MMHTQGIILYTLKKLKNFFEAMKLSNPTNVVLCPKLNYKCV